MIPSLRPMATLAYKIIYRHRINDAESRHDGHQSKATGRHFGLTSPWTLCLLIGMLWAPTLCAQTADEHASHHPGQPAGATPAVPAVGMAPMGGANPAPPAMAGGAGGMGGMGDMMKGIPADMLPR